MSITNLHLHRSLSRVLREGVSHCNTFLPLHPDTYNVLSGAIVVAMFAWVEENAHPDWRVLHDVNQPKPFSWVSWNEFVNMHKIRHCFAHTMDGTLLPNYADDIIAFCQTLSELKVQKEKVDGTIEIVQPYYSVNGNKITLLEGAVQRCLEITISYWSKATNTSLV